MKSIIFLLLTFALSIIQNSSIKAQTSVLFSESILDKLRLNDNNKGSDTNQYVDITGNPYMFKDFKSGKLALIDGKEISVIIRFDIYANQMHIKENGEVYAITNPEKVSKINIDGIKFVYAHFQKSIKANPDKQGSYFIEEVSGNFNLLVKKNIRIQDAEPAKPFQDAKPPKFITKDDTFFLQKSGGIAIKITNSKELLTILEENKDKINTYVESNKLYPNNLDDLKKIVNYNNEISKSKN